MKQPSAISSGRLAQMHFLVLQRTAQTPGSSLLKMEGLVAGSMCPHLTAMGFVVMDCWNPKCPKMPGTQKRFGNIERTDLKCHCKHGLAV